MGACQRSAIFGVQQHAAGVHADDRGELVEFFVDGIFEGFTPSQWNHLRSEANTMRGFHCHAQHVDVVAVLSGELTLGLKDLRDDSPTTGRSETLTLTSSSDVILIPSGVGHGFYFSSPSLLVFGASRRWSPDDEFGCRWDDRDLDIDWGCTDPRLSIRDQHAGTLADLRAELNR